MRNFRFWEKKEQFSVKELTITRSRKINLGNYESEDIFVALKVDIPLHENLHQAYDYCSNYLAARIKTEEAKIKEKKR